MEWKYRDAEPPPTVVQMQMQRAETRVGCEIILTLLFFVARCGGSHFRGPRAGPSILQTHAALHQQIRFLCSSTPTEHGHQVDNPPLPPEPHDDGD